MAEFIWFCTGLFCGWTLSQCFTFYVNEKAGKHD